MTTAVLVALVGIFVIGAVMRNNPWLWFLAGATMWGLGAWWIHSPFGDPSVNNIMLVIAFLGGFGMMMMTNWRSGKETEGFNFRIPKMFGGQSEEDELEARRRSGRTWRDRQSAYRDRLNNTMRGRR